MCTKPSLQVSPCHMNHGYQLPNDNVDIFGVQVLNNIVLLLACTNGNVLFIT
jgi:hypothetical protein